MVEVPLQTVPPLKEVVSRSSVTLSVLQDLRRVEDVSTLHVGEDIGPLL